MDSNTSLGSARRITGLEAKGKTLTPLPLLIGAGRIPAEGEDEREEALLFYVGTTRATQRLTI